jgi:WXG100 family type VII secretion target
MIAPICRAQPALQVLSYSAELFCQLVTALLWSSGYRELEPPRAIRDCVFGTRSGQRDVLVNVRLCNDLRPAGQGWEPGLAVWRPSCRQIAQPAHNARRPQQMAQQFGAQFEQMQSAANHVAEVNQSVQGQLSGLRNQLAPLAGAWKGQASTAFHLLMERWDTDARNLNEALNSIGEQIRGSGTTYAQADENENQTYSRISQALGS